MCNMFVQKIKLLILLQSLITGSVCIFENKVGRFGKESLKILWSNFIGCPIPDEQMPDSVLNHFPENFVSDGSVRRFSSVEHPTVNRGEL